MNLIKTETGHPSMSNAKTIPNIPSTPSKMSGVVHGLNTSVNYDPSSVVAQSAMDQRLDLGSMIEEVTSLIGKDNWIKYSQLISHFILGKLSRKELMSELNDLFGVVSSSTERRKLIRLHNQLLLGIFTNSLRESPLGNQDKRPSTWGFQNDKLKGDNMVSKRKVNKHNSQIETYKKIVMSLPTSDRNRLKMITKEAGKKGFIYCSVLQGRLSNVPKIPVVTNQDTLMRIKANNLKTPVEWSQDIVNGFNAPLATDNYALPDTDSLYLKMIGIAREHGLVGSVDTRCVDLLSMALDAYLKSIVEFGIDSVRYRKKKHSEYYDLNDAGVYVPVSTGKDDILQDGNLDDESENLSKMSLTNEDIFNALTIFPNLVEPTVNMYHSLPATQLYNDDELVVTRSSIDDLPEFLKEKPMFTPLDDKNIGTREELNWLIKDMLTEE
ncbi:Hfi1p KNAG_0D00660 [Huiozyma naganishii CBS 8797]|uniref:Transcriptional coactivator HFI1/ADA1 n=1 Tax=Huiozyma naganishii (strain ATCC MYA-139 / BCRC 22969 / CBS 8797 / KCTC 17520 / NBRC 10181 / NCYC 3082 / Yp74L-3) TaxID=1071383 RepID=J7RJY3_HUIN7|nr:hypothetical protein KNAG_0D00660 [Kazachstania naganishii CBS 8797]CCK69818.1 hypothetical protein KNAG_0D00660 [Kazachstania naganishii CBS 8797]